MKRLLIVAALLAGCTTTDTGRSPVQPARTGAGPTLPHAETTVGGERLEQYELAGLGLHAAAGLDVRLHRRVSALVEYKCTYARPALTIAGGTARSTALTHQVAAGLAIGLSR